MNTEELITAEASASEGDPDAPIRPGTSITRGHQRTRVLQVRLNPEELDALTQAAARVGLPLSTLARDLITSGLANSPTATRDLIQRIQSDLATLANNVA